MSGLRSKHSQLKLLANDMGTNVTHGISETWLQNTDNKKFWNVLSTSHAFFWCHRSQENVKKTAGCIMIFKTKILAPREQHDLNFFDKSKLESLCLDCLTNSSKSSKDEKLVFISNNPNESMQAKFLSDLAPKTNNSMSIASSITIIGDLIIYYVMIIGDLT